MDELQKQYVEKRLNCCKMVEILQDWRVSKEELREEFGRKRPLRQYHKL